MNPVVRTATALAALALSLGALTACGSEDDSSSAIDAACTARQDVIDSLAAVKDQLSSANFGAAKDALPAVGTAVEELQSSIKDLAADEKDKLTPEIDAVKSSWEAVKNPASITELQAALGALNTDINDLSSSLKSDLDCS
jgi:predicted  nucleic acid-binding Zn-ribbon protein